MRKFGEPGLFDNSSQKIGPKRIQFSDFDGGYSGLVMRRVMRSLVKIGLSYNSPPLPNPTQ